MCRGIQTHTHTDTNIHINTQLLIGIHTSRAKDVGEVTGTVCLPWYVVLSALFWRVFWICIFFALLTLFGSQFPFCSIVLSTQKMSCGHLLFLEVVQESVANTSSSAACRVCNAELGGCAPLLCVLLSLSHFLSSSVSFATQNPQGRTLLRGEAWWCIQKTCRGAAQGRLYLLFIASTSRLVICDLGQTLWVKARTCWEHVAPHDLQKLNIGLRKKKQCCPHFKYLPTVKRERDREREILLSAKFIQGNLLRLSPQNK